MSGGRGRAMFWGVLALLLVLNVAVWALRDYPAPLEDRDLEVPMRIGTWEGRNLELSETDLAILAPAKVISRAYHSRDEGAAADPARDWRVVWLNVIQTNSLGGLHNFYDSLVASGTRPSILKTHVIETARGPLRTSLIRYTNRQGTPYYLLLWYQWDGGNAEHRWRWYWEVLQLRLARRNTPWQLVEAATPITGPEVSPDSSPDLERLTGFARRLYESSASDSSAQKSR